MSAAREDAVSIAREIGSVPFFTVVTAPQDIEAVCAVFRFQVLVLLDDVPERLHQQVVALVRRTRGPCVPTVLAAVNRSDIGRTLLESQLLLTS